MAVMWNENLDREFIGMRRARMPVADMAAHFGTTVGAIYAHARVIKCLIQEHNPMSDAERATLQEMALAGASDNDLAAAFSRPVGSIRWNLGQLGLVGDRAARRNEVDYERLRRLVEEEGKTMGELEAVLGLSDTSIRKHLDTLGIKAARAPRVAKPRANRGKPGRPLSAIEPLNGNQVEFVNGSLGKLSLRAISAELGMAEKTLKQRAAAAGLSVTISMRRIGEPLTLDVLTALAAEGLTVTEAGKRLGRDGRTVAAAAASHNVVFQTRGAAAKVARQARLAQTLDARRADQAKRQAEVAGARAAREAERTAAREAMAAQRMAVRAGAHHDAAARKLAAQKLAARRTEAQKPATRKVEAKKPPARMVAAAAAPVAVRTMAPRQVAPRVVAAPPKVVHVMEAPAPVRDAVPAQPKPARHWNSGFLASGRPKVVLIQSEVDAAVARFIAERGVTRPAADPLEAAIMAARRMGFSVLRNGEGFVLDGRINLAGPAELQDFVRRREDVGLAISA